MGALALLCAPVVSAEQQGVESAESMSIDDAVGLLGLFEDVVDEDTALAAQPAADVRHDGEEPETAQAGPPPGADEAARESQFEKPDISRVARRF